MTRPPGRAEDMAVSAPPTDHLPVARPPIAVAEPQRWSISIEHVLYLGIGLLALLSHVYILGDRALHHDETLHAAYSWRIYQGQGYTHDPLLHGPFLYYITAFTYLLFGDTDFTARLSAAVFGIALTLLPWLMRREFGRGAALIASAYLLISPVALYVGRFIRHDIYAVVFELLSVIAIVRYVATERPLWHYTLAAAMALMLTTMETFYLFLLILGSFIVVWTLWEVARSTLWLIGAYLGVAGVALVGLTRIAGPIPLPTEAQALDIRHQPDNDLGAYFGKVGPVLGPLLGHPASVAILVATIALIGALVWLMFVRRGTDGCSAWRRAADNAPRGTLVGALDRIPLRQWLIAFSLAFVIYAVLYTALLSNLTTPNSAGLITGISGSFLYWLGQHEVQRGNQPPHYYLFQLAVYEPLLIVFGLAGIALVARRLWRIGRVTNDLPTHAERSIVQHTALFLPALLAWWSVGAFVIYSWAGEKMPWLTIHMVLPLTLLAAWAVARIWSWAAQAHVDRLALGLTITAGMLILLCFNRFTATINNPAAIDLAVVWPLLMVSFVVLLLIGIALIYRSARPATIALLSLVLAFGTFFTIRSSVRVNYINGDVPVEPLVFVQTSPDVPRMLDHLRRASYLRTGAEALPIRYDNETIWDWYLRNYTATDGSRGAVIDQLDDDVQVVLLLSENVPANEANLDGFARQELPLRWWFPECEVYRLPARDDGCTSGSTSLVSRFLSRPWDGQHLAETWRFWFDRQLPQGLGSTDWTLFVRPELAAEFGVGAGATP